MPMPSKSAVYFFMASLISLYLTIWQLYQRPTRVQRVARESKKSYVYEVEEFQESYHLCNELLILILEQILSLI